MTKKNFKILLALILVGIASTQLFAQKLEELAQTPPMDWN